MSKFNWINEDIKVEIPDDKLLLNTIAEAEELDLAKNVEYFCVADAIDVICKQLVTAGKMSHKTWNLICSKYPST